MAQNSPQTYSDFASDYLDIQYPHTFPEMFQLTFQEDAEIFLSRFKKKTMQYTFHSYYVIDVFLVPIKLY